LNESTSREICRAAVMMSLSRSRDEERELKEKYREQEIYTAAVDYGGEFISSVMKIIERAVVAAKREGIIGDHHNEEGAVAGATREAISQITNKAIGLNIGGKIGIARCGEHLAVCIFVGIGLLHLNENAIGLGHRAI
jgi:hypothetical protein